MLDELISGRIRKRVVGSEEDCYRLWGEEKLFTLSPVDMTIKASALVTSLDWVFVAGYQGALKHTFPDDKFLGWSAFLFTENNESSSEYSPTKIVETDRGRMLHGSKSWVAQSRSVDRLVVTLNSDKDIISEVGGVIVDRYNDGVQISSRGEPKFLKKMSQGIAIFHEVSVEDSQVFEPSLVRRFVKMESHYIILAVLSFLTAHLIVSRNGLFDRLVDVLTDYRDILKTNNEKEIKNLSSMGPTVQRCTDDFLSAREEYLVSWGSDVKLLYMYISGTRKKKR